MLPSSKRAIADRAATLTERIDGASPEPPQPLNTHESAHADAVVRTWSQTFSPGDPAAFERRLAWDGLDVTQARALIAGVRSADADSLPPWTDWLSRFAARTVDVRRDLDRDELAEARPEHWSDEPPFLELWIAPLRAARAQLRTAVPMPAWSRVGSGAHRRLEQQLVREISLVAERATYQRFVDFQTAIDEPDSPSGPDSYRAFILFMLDGGLEALFEEFPVLARQVALVTDLWVASTAEWLQRLHRDWSAITTRFCGGIDAGPVTDVQPALSDPHAGRRRVMVLTFASGARLVYKPRDVSLEAAFADFVRWADAMGIPASPRALIVVPREGYGWVEFAQHAALQDASEVAAYYHRCGGALCLAHALRGRDLHMGNVVATEAGPALIDVEMMLQPERGSVASMPPAVGANDEHADIESCLTTGLLSHFEVTSEGHVVDVGGLRGAGHGARSVPRRVWKHLRSAGLHPVDETHFATSADNRVTCGGVEMRPGDHASAIVAGFEEAYRFLQEHREQILASDGPLDAFSRCRSRVIPRPTDQYAMLASTLLRPKYQADGARRSAAMDILARPFRHAPTQPAVWALLVEERRALEALDVPFFWVPSNGTDVMAGDTTVLSGYFTESGISAVRARLASFSDADRARQTRVLARALAETPHARLASSPPVAPSEHGPIGPGLVAVAEWLGHEVRRLPNPDGLVLYDGLLGPALFFSALGTITGNETWVDAARASLRPIHAAIDGVDVGRHTGDRVGIGDGLGSLVYGLVWISHLTGDRAPLDRARSLAGTLAQRVRTDEHDDLLSGSAGAALALLALHAKSPEAEVLASVKACGDRLVHRQFGQDSTACWPGADGRRLVGFAHGAAGIGYALARVSEVIDDHAIREASDAAMRFVHDTYQAAERNWPVAQAANADDRAGGTMMAAWCHGAPGIAISLANARESMREPAMVQAALETTATWSPARADHLCCGTMGRVDVLLALGRRFGVAPAVHAATSLAVKVTTRAMAAGHFRLSTPGFEYRVYDPGFFRGLSGIGYGLLRCAHPDRLPSILAFEPPPAAAG